MKLTDRVAIVTGAASGIGRAAVQALAAEGCRVLATDIDGEGGAESARLAAAGGKVRFAPHDVTDEAQWAAAVAAALAAWGRLDILVNNAGIGTGQLVTEMSLEAWNRQLAINLTGPFLGTRAAIPAMRAGRRGGSIINISSVAGIEGAAGLAGYCASKGGLRLFTKAVAKEYVADGIRCNSLHPGIIDTPIWSKIEQGGLEAAADRFRAQPGANSLSADLIAAAGAPMQRAGRPGEIAAGILFLASDDSSYMTGAELVIDGGWTA